MRAELMRYRVDRLSSLLNILGLFLNVIYLIAVYSAPGITATDRFGAILGADIIYHILFMLMTFYVSEKVKSYVLNWCFVGGFFGIVQLFRMFLPIQVYQAGQITLGRLNFCIIVLILSAASLVAACVTSFIKSRKMHNYLNELNGEVK